MAATMKGKHLPHVIVHFVTIVVLMNLCKESHQVPISTDVINQPSEEDIIFTVPLINKNDRHNTQRVRRSKSDNQYIHITLPTPSKNIELGLFSSQSLLVPGATFEVGRGNITTSTPLRNDCYFQGKVLNTNESFAALSICNGLMGVYEFNGNRYSIEPVDVESDREADNSNRLHTIKRMNATDYKGMIDGKFELFGDEQANRRTKRAVEGQKYLEVMVVTDSTVVDFHGEQNTELFVLALFNMVNMIYGHSSLGVDIQLSLVKLLILENETADMMWKGDNPRQTLDRFCIYSAANSEREHEVGHYDFSMYLSRDRMAPAGYAPVTGMCRPDRSCALIKEDGFSTSFVAAHEIGHTIGMSHDGEGTNKCVNEPKRGSIMAPLVMANLNNYFWSPCSKAEIDSIISTLYCMNDDPFDVKWSDIETPLGRNWDLDEQCVKEFGDGFNLCSRVTHNFNPCEHLWCSTPGNRYLCKTKRAPPLPGSTCADARWCFNSQCIVANPDDPLWKDKTLDQGRLQSVDGSWSHWASWSECSTSCGRGIKSRTRTCNDPEPSLGGKDCVGDNYDIRLCDLPEQMRLVCKMFSSLSYSVRRACMKHKVYYRICQKPVDDVRLDQCTKYNKRGRTYLPFEAEKEEERCLLNCRTTEQGTLLYGEIEAVDGTFCSYDDRNSMCYSGRCIPVGCDGKLHSGAKEDMCGECKGDNTKCTLRQDYFNERLNRGYQLLVRLYPGTRNFRIKKPDDAYKLVLRNAQTNTTIISEKTKEPLSVIDFGSMWEYSDVKSETLECSGPLQAEYDIIIYSLYSGMRATLSITFTEPLDIVRESDNSGEALEIQREYKQSKSGTAESEPQKKYRWTTDGWGACSRTCGDGIQEHHLICTNTKMNRMVHDLLCKRDEKPNSIKKTCNLQPCYVSYRWATSDWTKCPDDYCSITKDVAQKRWAFCVNETPHAEVKWQRVKDIFCSSLDQPDLTMLCNRSVCTEPGYWQTGQFSECSVTCGPGMQTRDVTCLPINSVSSKQPTCNNLERPSDSEACTNRPCNQYIDTSTTSTTPSPAIYTTHNPTTITAHVTTNMYTTTLDSTTKTSKTIPTNIETTTRVQVLSTSQKVETTKSVPSTYAVTQTDKALTTMLTENIPEANRAQTAARPVDIPDTTTYTPGTTTEIHTTLNPVSRDIIQIVADVKSKNTGRSTGNHVTTESSATKRKIQITNVSLTNNTVHTATTDNPITTNIAHTTSDNLIAADAAHDITTTETVHTTIQHRLTTENLKNTPPEFLKTTSSLAVVDITTLDSATATPSTTLPLFQANTEMSVTIKTNSPTQMTDLQNHNKSPTTVTKDEIGKVNLSTKDMSSMLTSMRVKVKQDYSTTNGDMNATPTYDLREKIKETTDRSNGLDYHRNVIPDQSAELKSISTTTSKPTSTLSPRLTASSPTRFIWWWTATTRHITDSQTREPALITTQKTSRKTRLAWWWTATTPSKTTHAHEQTKSVSNQPTAEESSTSATRFVWWWTATTTPHTTTHYAPAVRTKFVWWWTAPSSTATVPESTTATPESTTGTPESTTATLDSTTDMPKSATTATPRSAITAALDSTTTGTPESTTATPESTAATPESRTATSESTVDAPESTTTDTPKSTTGTPESTTATPKSTTAASELTTKDRLSPDYIQKVSLQEIGVKPDSSKPDIELSKIEVLKSQTTTMSNIIQNDINKYPICDIDTSSICELMNASKCDLLLFRKLCCKTCLQFL